MTRCFGRTNGQPCPEPGTRTDPESRPVFVNPDDPDGPTISPVLCPAHYAEIMRRRDDNEASWRRMMASGAGR